MQSTTRVLFAALITLLGMGCNEYLLTSRPPDPDPTPDETPDPTPTPTPEYLGREFVAIDLDNYFAPGEPNAAAAQFAVAVSNPDPSVDAAVTVSDATGVVASVSVSPLGLEVIQLPETDVDDTSRSTSAYRIESDIPVTAHQFNPLGNVLVYSNDASLLLPTTALGKEYRVVSWPQTGVASDWNALRGFVTIVAVEPGETHVSVTARGRIVGGGGIPAVDPGNSVDLTLQQYEVVSLATSTQGHDLTGSPVIADKRIAVFGGSECSNVPLTATACDHLEEQLFPVQSWGRTYVAAKSKVRFNEPDIYRIVAANDGTTITTTPAQPGTPATLNDGELLQIESRNSFIIDASAPVTVAQYLVGQDYGAGTGDPAQMMVVPVEQFRTDYLFLTPPNYNNDSITIVAPVGTSVTLDGQPVPGNVWGSIGNATGWARAIVDVADGPHALDADQPVGVTVTGYDLYVSYGYPGGLNLEALP